VTNSFQNRLRSFLQDRANRGYSRLGVPVYVPSNQELEKFEKTAKNIGIPPEWFANLVNHESAGTFSPRIQNPSSNATGLIQFMPTTARDFSTSVDELKEMSFSRQLDYVAEYLKRVLKTRKQTQADGVAKTTLTQPDFFMVVFYPAAIGNPMYNFPQYVSNANNGIRTPSDYLLSVYNKSTPPFPEFSDPLMTVSDYIGEKRTPSKPFPMMSTGRTIALGGLVFALGIFIIVLSARGTKRYYAKTEGLVQ
jgi:hypothetical protein